MQQVDDIITTLEIARQGVETQSSRENKVAGTVPTSTLEGVFTQTQIHNHGPQWQQSPVRS